MSAEARRLMKPARMPTGVEYGISRSTFTNEPIANRMIRTAIPMLSMLESAVFSMKTAIGAPHSAAIAIGSISLKGMSRQDFVIIHTPHAKSGRSRDDYHGLRLIDEQHQGRGNHANPEPSSR